MIVAANFTSSLFTYPNTKYVFRVIVCLNVSEHAIYFKASIVDTNVPGDKSCIVPLPGLNQQLYVSPMKETKETKNP